jgi:glycosyltransferase involved in cell wall biosynthesis
MSREISENTDSVRSPTLADEPYPSYVSFTEEHAGKRVIDRILADNNRRGKIRKIPVRGTRIITEQGLRSFLHQLLEKLQKRELSLVNTSDFDLDYARWIARNEPTETELVEQRYRTEQFGYRPLISIVTPVWNPPADFLADTIESVLSQTYENWELCVADGDSNEEVKKVLRGFAKQDNRIRVKFLDKNLGISQNSNIAIDFSQGDFIALLDHDDLLAPFALFEMVDCLNRAPELDFVYSDKDSMDVKGKRFNPLFKPNWSPEIMFSANYPTHLCVIRTKLINALGGFRSETDGAQDWDLFLRVTKKTDQIHHIPKILYHWRLAPASVSSTGLNAKPYAANAQLLALNQHLERSGREGGIRFNEHGHLRVAWRLGAEPKVSVIIYSRDVDSSLQRCLESIYRKTSYKNFEVIVVCGSDQPQAPQEEFPNLRLVQVADQLNYSSANNFGVRYATGKVFVFLDPRIEVVSTDWLEELAGWSLQPRIGAVGAKLLYPNGEIYHGGIIIGMPGYVFSGAREESWSMFGHTEWYRNYSAVSGACLATSTVVFKELNHFDVKLKNAADIEFCLRAIGRNYRVVYTPYAKLIQHQRNGTYHESMQLPDVPEYHQAFQAGDPYFNPNLSYKHTVPKLKQS